MKKIIILFFFLLSFQAVAQVQEGSVYQEANPVYQEIIDNSAYANLWRQVIELRKAGDESNYLTSLQQLQTEYPEKFLGSQEPEIGSDAPASIENSTYFDATFWTDELLIYTGNLGVSQGGNPTIFKKMIKSFADTLGNLYVAFTTNWYNSDLLKFYKSTDKGFTWKNFSNLTPGTGRKFQGFDVDITDTTGGWKIGMVLTTVPIGGSGYSGRVYYADMNDDGSGYSVKLIQAPVDTKGYTSPAIVTDGFNWSPGSTYWYLTYQEVDTTSGLGSAALAAFSANGGTSWTIDTVRTSYNDYELDIDYNFRADSIYVLLTNNIVSTNQNLRLFRISLSNLGTGASWIQYNLGNTADPEFDGTLAVNRGDSSMAIIHSIEVGGNKNIQYSYTSDGRMPMVNNANVASTSNLEERATIHSPATQNSTYRIAYISSVSGFDTILYRNTTNIASGFGSSTVVTRVNEASSSLSPCVLGFKDSGAHNGGVFFGGAGPTNLYFNSSNLVSDVNEKTLEVKVYSLEQNYPNPFNPSTTIKFSIPEQTNVTLKIFNSIGQEVASLLNGQMAAGNHSVDFNASKLSSGVYFYRIDSPSFTSTKKMILIK